MTVASNLACFGNNVFPFLYFYSFNLSFLVDYASCDQLMHQAHFLTSPIIACLVRIFSWPIKKFQAPCESNNVAKRKKANWWPKWNSNNSNGPSDQQQQQQQHRMDCFSSMHNTSHLMKLLRQGCFKSNALAEVSLLQGLMSWQSVNIICIKQVTKNSQQVCVLSRRRNSSQTPSSNSFRAITDTCTDFGSILSGLTTTKVAGNVRRSDDLLRYYAQIAFRTFKLKVISSN